MAMEFVSACYINEKCRSTESIQGATGGCPVGSLFRLMNYDIASKYEENR